MKSQLHHVGIIVPTFEQMNELMQMLGLTMGRRYYVPEYEADCIFTEGPGPAIEFIVPKGGKLEKFNKGMGGLHHIALEVNDLGAVARELAAKEIALLESQPVNAGPILINFLPPTYTRGVIVEFVQPVPTGTAGPAKEQA